MKEIPDSLRGPLGLATTAKDLARALDRDADSYLRLVQDAPGSAELAEVEKRLRSGVAALKGSLVGRHYGKAYAGAMEDAVQRPKVISLLSDAVERIRKLRDNGDDRSPREVASASVSHFAADESPDAQRLRTAFVNALEGWDAKVQGGQYERVREPVMGMADEVLASLHGVAATTLRDHRTKRNRAKS